MKQLNIRVYGIVQGVGFRPFVSRLAKQCGLRGSVCNRGSYVEIVVQGRPEILGEFQTKLHTAAPERSAIWKVETSEQELTPFDGFSIIDSVRMEPGQDPEHIIVSPDIAICPVCRQELYDPENRRYLHSFINCTACGPRLTILKQMPYDRERTTMSVFPMCGQCADEYETVGSRRYDAQPVCCSDCGPQVYLMDEPQVRGAEAIRRTREVLRTGGIAAVKGIGGFHLCCDAGNEAAVALLRARKMRPAKPFAVMARDLKVAREICVLDTEQELLLDGPQKPILICKKNHSAHIAPSVAPGNPTLGVMLPYAPLQLLLFDDPADPDQTAFPEVLVMTSGNRGGAPICRSDADVRESLEGLCDIVLTHDREILMRADDSVVEAAGDAMFTIRRSRGYAPLPITVSEDWRGEVLAVGGELKNVFCIGKGAWFYPSPYVGDLSDLRTEQALAETVGRMLELFEAKPRAVACDLHPDYRSAAYARTLGLPVYEVQHHYAHILSCMAEHDALTQTVIGVAFDGTGYGTDGTVWGGEFLLAGLDGFTRIGSLQPFVQMGGDAAAREGWRIAVSLLLAQYDTMSASEKNMFTCSANDECRSCAGFAHDTMKTTEFAECLSLCEPKQVQILSAARAAGFGCVTSTSAGRLFDAVSALLGIRTASSFEGEAAMALQYEAQRALHDASGIAHPSLQLKDFTADTDDGRQFVLAYEKLLDWLIQERLAGRPLSVLAYAFHEALAEGITEACCQIRAGSGLHTVALSGGCFCNRLLLELTIRKLEAENFDVLVHRSIPANDGGIALGQAVYAMGRLNRACASEKQENNND